VPLFIDRLPLQHRLVESAGRRVEAWYPLLPALLAPSRSRKAPTGEVPRPWKFDTGCAQDACAWRFHLERAGLDLADVDELDPQTAKIRTANDAVEDLPIRMASLWLVSNIPALRPSPYPLFLAPGVPFYDRSPRRTDYLYPLVGMRAFRRAGLSIKIDFKAATISVWTPGPWHRRVSLFLRRMPHGFTTIPFGHLCPNDWH
jgi:hypothetical protein